MGGVSAILLDNPILVKHARSRLRRNRVIPWSVVLVTLCVTICWGFYQVNRLTSTTPLALVVMLQVVTLIFAGAGEVSSAVGGARESGILDFHRVTPLPPLWVALGFALGAPLLEYWLTLLTLPFAIFLAVVGPSGWQGLLAFELPLLLAAWLVHSITLLVAMIGRSSKSGIRGLIGLVITGVFLGQGLFFSIESALTDVNGEMARLSFFGTPVPWILLVVVYEAVLIFFLFIPPVRRMRSDRAHLYSKRQAIAFMATIIVLVLGLTWHQTEAEYLVLGLLYGFVLVAIVLSMTITPNRSEYLKGLRRAHRLGRKRPSPWSDDGTNRIPLFALGGLVLLGSTIAWEVIEGRTEENPGSYSATIALGVLTIAYVGLGLQAAQLYMKQHGKTLFGLFLFFVWLVPIVIGGCLGAGSFSPTTSLTVAAISPLAGILLTTNLVEQIAPAIQTDRAPIQIAALTPALAFAFLFHSLLETIQRRLGQAVREGSPNRLPDPFDEFFDHPGSEKKSALRTISENDP